MKRLFRKMLRDMGAASQSSQRKAFKDLLTRSDVKKSVTFYGLRSAVTTDMTRAGVSDLALRYLTGHAVNDVLASYVGIEPHEEMAKYFTAIEPLLEAINERADQLGLDA